MKKRWHFYKWRNDTTGQIDRKLWLLPTQWQDLKKEANENEGQCVPRCLKKDVFIAMLFLCVYPHRIDAGFVRWLDAQISKL